MDRPLIYDGQVPLTRDLLDMAQYNHISHAALLEALRGNQTAGVYGLGIKQTPSPGLQVVMSRGVLAAPLPLNSTAYSSLPQDTSKTLLKYAIVHGDYTVPATVTLPSGSLKQICIVQVGLSEMDIEDTILPYYNESDPATAHLGPGDSGTAQARRRAMAVSATLKYGNTTTGTPTPPTPDAGQIALAQFELRSTTTQITAAADSATNAQIKDYEGAAGTPRLNNFAQLDAALNLFEGDLQCEDLVAAGTVTSLGKMSSGVNASLAADLVRLGQFSADSATKGHFTIPVVSGNDIIVQWQTETTTGASGGQAGGKLFAWDTPFPNAIFAAVATVNQNSNSVDNEDDNVCWIDTSTTGGTVYSRQNRAVTIIAIGS